MLSIIFCQSQHYQPIVEIFNILIMHIFLANTPKVLLYHLRFTDRLVDEPHSLFRRV